MELASTAKQHIYQRMLMKITDYRGLSNLQVIAEDQKAWLNELAFQADLLHGIVPAIINAEITGLDVIFLNRHARYYLSVSQPMWVNGQFFKLMIYELYTLVATQRRSELSWLGPELDDEDFQALGLSLPRDV